MENNRIYQGEKLSFVGQLKDDGVATTDYTMTYQLITVGGKMSEEQPVSVKEDFYSADIDTSKLLGEVNVRFIVRKGDSGKIVNKFDTPIIVHK